jgi:hypothetical protein
VFEGAYEEKGGEGKGRAMGDGEEEEAEDEEEEEEEAAEEDEEAEGFGTSAFFVAAAGFVVLTFSTALLFTPSTTAGNFASYPKLVATSPSNIREVSLNI